MVEVSTTTHVLYTCPILIEAHPRLVRWVPVLLSVRWLAWGGGGGGRSMMVAEPDGLLLEDANLPWRALSR